jgi:hypothetical protein
MIESIRGWSRLKRGPQFDIPLNLQSSGRIIPTR